jgi:hypothetical protein
MTRRGPQTSAEVHRVERVQTGVRLERHMLKVLKAIAEYHEMSLGDLIEGIVLHAFDGKPAFSERGLERIREFKRLYGLTLGAAHSHRLIEGPARSHARAGAARPGRVTTKRRAR